MDAYQLLSQTVEVPIANVVDANYSTVVKARKSLLPRATAYGGLHEDLRRRDTAEIEAVEKAVVERGGRATGAQLDVRDGPALTGWVEAAAGRLGGIDAVVANVSALAIPDTEGNWDAPFEVDLMHTVRLATAAIPHLEASPNGSIVAVSSLSGREADFTTGTNLVVDGALTRGIQL